MFKLVGDLSWLFAQTERICPDMNFAKSPGAREHAET